MSRPGATRATPAPAARPTRAELLAACGRRVPDLIAPDLRVLFCGINPSLYSAVVGHHFARPGNRFWPTLHRAGFTERLLAPSEQAELLERGIGITNVFPEASASAASLSRDDYRAGSASLRRTLARYRPRLVAFLGLGAYRITAGRPEAVVGPQAVPFAGIAAWALPNPSGLNAHYQLAALVECYRALARVALGSEGRR
ncbi:MAG TPA: G/U mismatch-specific DNA glycosylase [Polyangiaceae bacterium]|nr:G/U mismatch-specific DNA glycosylase [Polyangiaceae bacterium]